MKKNGFTLIELLAVIVVIILLSLLLVPKVSKIIEENRTKGYKEIENRLKEVGQKYLLENYVSSDTNTIIISKEELIAGNYIEEIKDIKDNTPCDAEIILVNLLTIPKIESKIQCSNYQTLEEFQIINLIVDLDGGTINSNPSGAYLTNTEIILPNPTKPGYIFNGWNVTSAEGLINENILTLGSTDTIITASWLEKTLLTVNLDGGTITSNPEGLYNYGTTINLLNPTKPNCIFDHWEKTTGNSILSVNNLTIGTEDTTIKAIWTTTSLLMINLDGGNITLNPAGFHPIGEKITLVEPTKPGYTFSGWKKETGNVEINENDLIIKTENSIIKANWTRITYKIIYTLNDGTASNPTEYNVESDSITLTNPTKAGYDFAGWTGSNGTTKQPTVTIPNGSTGNKSYTANWTPSTYTITYNCNGGQGSTASTTFVYENTTILTANGCYKITAGSSGTVYYFKGWAKTSNATSVLFTDKQNITNSAQITSNTTLYAIWDTLFTISGNSEVINDGSGNWRLKIKGASGYTYGTATITFKTSTAIDAFVVGGGGGGGGYSYYAGEYSHHGGGGSGSTNTYTNIPITAKSYTVSIGRGGAGGGAGSGGASSGTQSYFNTTSYAAAGGTPGSGGGGGRGGSGGSGGGGGSYRSTYSPGGAGGTKGTNGATGHLESGGKGQKYSTCEFALTSDAAGTCPSGIIYASGGAGGAISKKPVAGASNTGNGGGGGAGYSSYKGAAGGSGIVVIRNHR